MAVNYIQHAIVAIQSGNKAEGARFLRIALKSGELTPELRALAYLWLAETSDDLAHKRACYSDALTADPNNADARQRLAAVLQALLPPAAPSAPAPSAAAAIPAPPTSPPAAAPPPVSMPESQTVPGVVYPARMPNTLPHIVGIIGGPNGPGTGLFVNQDGIVATTRYIVGGSERLTIELEVGRQVVGHIVRAYPDMDIALLRVEERRPEMLPITPYPRVPDDTALLAVAYGGQVTRGRQRPTKRVMAAFWIPTDFVKLPDAGGNPLFDERNYLVGMLTKNSSRSSGYLYGVHISGIHQAVERYYQESQPGAPARAYCPNCGAGSRAAAALLFYCEICGSTKTHSRHITRYPNPQMEAYYEVSRIRCTRCQAQVGFYNGVCLRCGQAPGGK